MYQVIFAKRAARKIKELSGNEASRIIESINALANDPRPPGSKKLKGTKAHFWRIRKGNYRIIYSIDDQVKIVKVAKVGHRKDVYDF